MSRNGVACSTPSLMIRMRPACSTTKILPSFSGWARKTGAVRPVVMKGSSLRVRPGGSGPPSPGPVESEWHATPNSIAIPEHSRPTEREIIAASLRRKTSSVYISDAPNQVRATHMPRKSPAARRERSHRDFLQIPDFSAKEIDNLFSLAEKLRSGKYMKKPLAGKSLTMSFMKSSTRTRVSFEVGTWQLGGHALFLSPRDVQLGRGEPIADTARVLSRYVDGIMIRTFAHAEIEELARYASVPVINGLTDLVHPCPVLEDVLNIKQQLGDYRGKRVAWIGDGNNMANSWLNAAYVLGFELNLACPEGYDPNPMILQRANSKARITLV